LILIFFFYFCFFFFFYDFFFSFYFPFFEGDYDSYSLDSNFYSLFSIFDSFYNQHLVFSPSYNFLFNDSESFVKPQVNEKVNNFFKHFKYLKGILEEEERVYNDEDFHLQKKPSKNTKLFFFLRLFQQEISKFLQLLDFIEFNKIQLMNLRSSFISYGFKDPFFFQKLQSD